MEKFKATPLSDYFGKDDILSFDQLDFQIGMGGFVIALGFPSPSTCQGPGSTPQAQLHALHRPCYIFNVLLDESTGMGNSDEPVTQKSVSGKNVRGQSRAYSDFGQ